MRQDSIKVTIDDQYEYALSIAAKVNDLGWPWRVIMHSVSKHARQGVAIYIQFHAQSVLVDKWLQVL